MFLKSFMRRGGAAAFVLVSAIGMQGSAAAQVVGKAVAVNQDSTAAGRMLSIGAAVVHNERIVTNARGSTQLLFIDRTTLNIGPNSDLLIDEYVFDPNRGVGRMTVSLSKGFMRFVGGRITHNGSASVKTPPATIGIRGGVVDISTNGKSTTASNSYGIITITPSGGGSVNVPQGSTASTSGGAPTLTITTQQQANSDNQRSESQGGQTGGVSQQTSSSAARYSNNNTATTSTITTASGPAPGSTAPGPSTTAASGDGTPTSNPNSPINIFSSLGGLTSPGTSSGATASPGGNTPSATQQTAPSTSTSTSGGTSGGAGGGKGGGGGPPP